MDTALTLTTDMKLVLGLVGFTMAMFLFERIRADVVALVVMVVLGVTGLIAPEEIFGGFSGNAVMSIIATTILGAGLDRTGALNRLAGWLLRRSHGVEKRLLLLTTATAGLNSSFMQNPSVMALYLPVASRLASRTTLTLKRLLLPISAAIVMGGALTMVGNSPLILLNDLLMSANNNLPSGTATIEPLRMFAPLPIGVALVIASLAYFHFYGSRKLREEEGSEGDDAQAPARTESYFAKAYGIEGDVFELLVTAESPLVGMTVSDAENLFDAHLGGQRDRRDGAAAAGIGFRAEPVPAHVLAPEAAGRPVQPGARRHLRGRGATDLAGDRQDRRRAAPAQGAWHQPAGDQPRQAGHPRGRAQHAVARR
jgi:di/tricarboxylate transporter